MQKIRSKLNNRNVTVFWRYFSMTCVFPLLLIVVLLVNGKRQSKMLIDKNISEMQINLDASCEQLSEDLLLINEFPVYIENSVPYSKIMESEGDLLQNKYYPSAMNICSLISLQATFLGNYSEIMVCIPSLNTVCSKQVKIQSIENYFSDCIQFSDTDESAVMKNLRAKSSLTIYPIENITVGNTETMRQFAVTCHPINRRTGVMAIISECEFLDRIGFNGLPEGSFLKVITKDGEIFEMYPSDQPSDESDYYTLDSNLFNDNFKVTVYIPIIYFREQTRSYYTSLYFSFSMFLLFAFAICILVSNASSKPIRDLYERTKTAGDVKQNELKALDTYITNSGIELASLKDSLVQSQLVRLFYGNALTDEEENHLKKDLKNFTSFRIALIEMKRNSDHLKVASILENSLEKKCRYVIISRVEVGFLFSGDGNSLATFVSKINEIDGDGSEIKEKIRCGISEVFSDLGSFADFLRQARAAIPQKYEAKLFTPDGNTSRNLAIFWTPHEKLYRSILSKNEIEALSIIRKAALTADSENACIFYDNMAFVILCSANEMGINTKLIRVHRYDERLSPSDNFSQLEFPLKKMMTMLRDLEKNNEEDKKQLVMVYIRKNFCDSSLCVSQVAEHLNIRETEVSDAVRQYASQSFTDYVADLRMKKVIDLMMDFSKSLSDIAEECGYPAESTFYRVFKSHYNRTPASYRRMLMAESDKEKSQ